MVLAHQDEGLRENENLRGWDTARRLAELGLERAVFRIFFVTVAVLICMYAMLFADLHTRCMNISRSNLSSLLVYSFVEAIFSNTPSKCQLVREYLFATNSRFSLTSTISISFDSYLFGGDLSFFILIVSSWGWGLGRDWDLSGTGRVAGLVFYSIL